MRPDLTDFKKDLYNRAKLEDLKIGLVVSKWHDQITDTLSNKAIKELLRLGLLDNHIRKWEVPGSFELIYLCDKIAKKEVFDALIAIGVVIKGETMHFEYICQGVSQGIKEINLKYDTPVIFGVLTTNNLKQAEERSLGQSTLAYHWAASAVEMAILRKNNKDI